MMWVFSCCREPDERHDQEEGEDADDAVERDLGGVPRPGGVVVLGLQQLRKQLRVRETRQSRHVRHHVNRVKATLTCAAAQNDNLRQVEVSRLE